MQGSGEAGSGRVRPARRMGAAARAAALAGLVAVLGGCPGEESPERALERDAEGRTPLVSEVPAAPLAAVPLVPMEGSGISGQAQLEPRAGETVISVRVSGAQPNAVYPARVHTGRCDDQGVERAQLEPIRTDASGQGWSESVVALPAHELATGRDFLQVYVAQGELHQAVACGNLPERPDLAPVLEEQP